MIHLREKTLNLFAILLGLVTANNVIYVTKLGNTHINISIFYSLVLLIILLVVKRNSMNILYTYFSRLFLAFFIVILLSSINMLYVFSGSGFETRFFNGLVEYILWFVIYANTLLLKEHKKYIVKGLIYGLIANILFTLLQYVVFKTGNILSLHDYFPQPDFANFIWKFRSQGFFREPSHLLQYLISTHLLFYLFFKKSISKTLFVFATIYVLILSTSGNVVILIIQYVLFRVFNSIKNKGELKKINIIILFFGISFLFIVIIINFFTGYLSDISYISKVEQIFSGADLLSEDNYIRTQSMISTLNLIREFPFGVGFNMTNSIFEQYAYMVYSHDTFNYLLRIQLELGFVGTFLYLLRIYFFGFKLALNGLNLYQRSLGVTILSIEIAAIGNGYFFPNSIWIIYGLASIELENNKKRKLELISLNSSQGEI